MAEVEFPARLSLPLDPERLPAHDDLWRGADRRVRGDEIEASDSETEVSDSPAMNEVDAQSPRGVAMRTEATVTLQKLQERLARNPLDEIATLVQGLTYGAMIELSDAMWKVQSEGSAVTRENLPALLYRWSKSRSATVYDASEGMPAK